MPNPILKNFLPKNLTITNPVRNLYHIFDEDDCYAMWAAYSSGRPLLIRGKPGTGKSQMAKAIADQLGWGFVSEVIRGNTELDDLHWRFDAIGRLGEAQASGIAKDGSETAQERLKPQNYLSPGAFWWAYDWKKAEDQQKLCDLHAEPQKPEPVKDWKPETGGVVLLLDEIDKAEPDLPNGLLETLGNYQFNVPYSEHKTITADPKRLLIIITTNEERELPTAFVRRCFVHTLKMEDSTEKDDDGIEKRHRWLMERGELHFGTDIAPEVYKEAAIQLWKDRDNSKLRYPPGLAEYIDLLKALQGLEHDEQIKRLARIAQYALKKDME